MLVEQLADHWSLEALTRLVYDVPKLSIGADLDAPPTEETQKAQRAFFVNLYQLICSSDTGPRLPTLLLAIGREKACQLLGRDAPGERSS
jgi:lysyl-tRNA synthetase class 1